MVFLVNGYVTKYMFLFIVIFLIEIALLMLAVYAEDLLSKVMPIHILAIKQKNDKLASSTL